MVAIPSYILYLAPEEVAKKNLIAQAGLGDLVIPETVGEIYKYKRHPIEGVDSMSDAYAEAHNIKGLSRSPMVGDLIGSYDDIADAINIFIIEQDKFDYVDTFDIENRLLPR